MIYSFILLLWEFVSLMNIRAVTEEEFCLISTDMSARVESVDWHDDVKLVKLISDQLEVSVMIRAVHELLRSFAVFPPWDFIPKILIFPNFCDNALLLLFFSFSTILRSPKLILRSVLIDS